MYVSQRNTHNSPSDPYIIFLYYTLNGSSFPHNKSKFIMRNYHNKVLKNKSVNFGNYANKNPTNRL